MPSDSVNFDHAAGFYDATRGYPLGVDREVARVIAQAGGLSTKSQVLEIGAGTGRIALPLAEHVGSIYGVDISRQMLKRLLEKRSDERVFPVIGDALVLPYPESTFDAVVITHVLHLVADPVRVVNETRRVLRPGSPLLHCTNTSQIEMRDIYDASNAAIGVERFRDPNWHGVPALLDQMGWRLHGEPVVSRYKHSMIPAELVTNLEKRTWSSLWHVSDAALARGVAALREEIARRFADPDAPITVTGEFSVTPYLSPV